MSRPKKCRRVGFIPENQYFYPRQHCLEEVLVFIEEIEAVRLADLEGLEQAAAAEKMNISRGTFQRIVYSARKKIAEALVYGKAIRIEGGNYIFTGRKHGRRFRGGRG
ncbi:MAG: DUF134 domain-containing protein [Firmicutes bacterium]|nr:DUF134 domain-containing protein [Bacillota bacterium]